MNEITAFQAACLWGARMMTLMVIGFVRAGLSCEWGNYERHNIPVRQFTFLVGWLNALLVLW